VVTDDKMIYFRSNRKGGQVDSYRKASNGAGTEELLLERRVPESVSPDGKLLLYNRSGEKTAQDIWVLPLTPAGEKVESRVFLQARLAKPRANSLRMASG
jgi:dipeptidyl aminopeptidase/acylaminoacyl peptidase